MCYDSSARPPYPPVAGGSGSGREIVLTASDGTEFAALSALADQPTGAGIVVLPDVRGLHGFYQELALRFAETGIHATAIDYFGRTAGVGMRGDDFEFMSHVMQTRPGNVARDVAAAITHLQSDEGGQATSVFTVGFCFGGRHSFNQSAEGHGIAGAIGFYGKVTPRDETDDNAPIDKVADYRAPILGLFGGADLGIPKDSVEMFAKALEAEEVAHEIKIYDGAPHSFFDRGFDQFKSECDDAWDRILDFIRSRT